jgi:HK97 gp10 family phage protein
MARGSNVTVRFQLTGVGPLLQTLNRLRRGLRNRILRKALRRGSKPMVQAVRALAPTDTRELRRSIGTRSRTYRRGGVIVFVIGPRNRPSMQVPKGGVKPRRYNPAYYAHLVELGTRRSGKFPFVRPGFIAAQGRAHAIIVAEIKQGIDNVARTGKP